MRKGRNKIKPHNLIYIYLVTTIIVTVITLAKFQSTTTNSSKTNIAIYAINAYRNDETKRDLTVDCAGTENTQPIDSCSYVITNKENNKITEVAVKYKIKINLEKELPEGITIKVKDKNENEGNVTKQENSYIYENETWKFPAGQEEQNIITISFQGENKEGETSSTITNVQVSVIVEQID